MNNLKCINCSNDTVNMNSVCDTCYRDPKTNNCAQCKIKHLSGICYPYVCKSCVNEDIIKRKKLKGALIACNLLSEEEVDKLSTEELKSFANKMIVKLEDCLKATE